MADVENENMQKSEETPEEKTEETPQEPEAPEEKAEDTKGQTVNRFKHERELKNRDAEIARLKAELEKARGASGDTQKLREEFEAYKAAQESEALEKKLKAAGCINTKAARAVLDDYEGDIAKLKTATPYLFASTDNTQSTGGTPKTTSSQMSDQEKRMRRAAGLDVGDK